MKKNLNTYAIILFSLALTGVLLIGALSLSMVKAIMHKMHLIEQEVKNEDLVNAIHIQTYKLALSIQHSLVDPEQRDIDQTAELFRSIEAKLHPYIAYEQRAEYPEAKEEVRLLTMLAANLDGMKRIAPRAPEHRPLGTPDQEKFLALEEHVAAIDKTVGEINALHFAIITRKVAKANDRMTTVVNLYLLFSGLGIVFVAVAYTLHARSVVAPLRQLVVATQELTAGNTNPRLPTGSMTEIGLLCTSFNRMSETIQKNEAMLLHFNQQLEQKVRERTRDLENTCASLTSAQNELIRMEHLATLGQVATSVNHEIKTPLNALSMNLQLLRKDKERCCSGCDSATSRMDKTIRIIAQETARISDILDEFVRYARFSPPILQPNDLNPIIRTVADLLSERAKAAKVQFRLSLTDALPQLMLDENKMIQALLNLCLNAIQAMPEGGELTVETTDTEEGIVLTIADTGPGIPAADQERIFQPFFSTKAMGLGFGLPIVQKIIEDHGGRITCQSKNGEGARFAIQLPEPFSGEEKTHA